MDKCDNIIEFCQRFKKVTENACDLSLDDSNFIKFWKTELAMAILKDLGDDLGKEVAKIMTFLCEQC